MTKSDARKALKQEALAQSKQFDALKKWLKNALHLSTISLVLALFGSSLHPFVQIAGWILLALSAAACLTIGLGLKRGRDNLASIFALLEQNA